MVNDHMRSQDQKHELTRTETKQSFIVNNNIRKYLSTVVKEQNASRFVDERLQDRRSKIFERPE